LPKQIGCGKTIVPLLFAMEHAACSLADTSCQARAIEPAHSDCPRMEQTVPEETDYRRFYWYHSIDLGNDVVTQGDYDMKPHVPHYRFPECLAGKKALDVGRASGFFAFEFERRGADVTATEIAGFLDWDFVGGRWERMRRAVEIADQRAFDEYHITGAFHFAHAALRSRVKPVTIGIYDIGPDTLKQAPFDVVFCGSVTSHLRDPVRALENLRSVTADDGVCIVASPYIGLDESRSLMAMVTDDVDRRSWWMLNKSCLGSMLRAAGFASVDIVSQFDLFLSRTNQEIPHIVAHARPTVGTDAGNASVTAIAHTRTDRSDEVAAKRITRSVARLLFDKLSWRWPLVGRGGDGK
jgi:tRNA (mo5U34)-methyltransferase